MPHPKVPVFQIFYPKGQDARTKRTRGHFTNSDGLSDWAMRTIVPSYLSMAEWSVVPSDGQSLLVKQPPDAPSKRSRGCFTKDHLTGRQTILLCKIAWKDGPSPGWTVRPASSRKSPSILGKEWPLEWPISNTPVEAGRSFS